MYKLMFLLIFVTVGLLPARTDAVAGVQGPPPAIDVTFHQGVLTLNAVNAPLADVLFKIAQTAGFTVVIYGSLNQSITLFLANVNLPEGIRLVAGNHSTIMLQQPAENTASTVKPPGTLVRLWVFGEEQNTMVDEPTSEQNAQFTSQYHIIQQLHHLDPAAWGAAIQEVYGLQEEAVIALLSQVLSQDKDPTVREQAITALASIGSNAAINAMATALGDRETAIRRHAIQTLSEVGSDHAIQTLGQVLFGDKNPDLRRLVVQIMAAQGNQAARAFLTAAAKDPDAATRRMAGQFLQN